MRDNRLCETPTLSRNNIDMQTRQSQTPNILKNDGKKSNLILTEAPNLPSTEGVVNFLSRKPHPDDTPEMGATYNHVNELLRRQVVIKNSMVQQSHTQEYPPAAGQIDKVSPRIQAPYLT